MAKLNVQSSLRKFAAKFRTIFRLTRKAIRFKVVRGVAPVN